MRRSIIALCVVAWSSAAYAVSGSISLKDVAGEVYFIDTDTPEQSSSASGAASEADFTSSRLLTTTAGSKRVVEPNDAFDGYNAICLKTPAYTSGSLAGCGDASTEFFANDTPITGFEDGKREAVFAVHHFANGIDGYRKVFVPENDEFARWLNIFTNTTAAPVSFSMLTDNNLGSDSATTIFDSSLGNVASITDATVTWIGTYPNQNIQNDPRLGHILQSTGSPPVPLAYVNFTNGNDRPLWAYNLTLQPGQTAIIMNLVTTQADKASVSAHAAALVQVPGTILQGMTAVERAQVVNFVIPCAALKDQCNDVVDDGDGGCTVRPLDNTPCNDDSVCTTVDRCVAGVCAGALPLQCDNAPCKACDPVNGCQTDAASQGNACDDKNTCTKNDVCSSGTCAGVADDAASCDDGNACTNDVCSSGTCLSASNGGTSACDDKNPCTSNDVCNGAGHCAGSADNTAHCTDNNDCTDDSCSSGVCASTANSATTCNDGTCTPGVCFSGACIIDKMIANGTSCDAHDPCLDHDTCFSGECVAVAKDCSVSADSCSIGACQAGVGCVTSPRSSGTCDDQDPCTTGDSCSDSGCTGIAVDCSALDGVCMVGTCTDGQCAAQAAPDGTACDGGACSNGACKPPKKHHGCAATTTPASFAVLLALTLALHWRRRRV